LTRVAEASMEEEKRNAWLVGSEYHHKINRSCTLGCVIYTNLHLTETF
jgi:hypothetical protein